MCAHKQHLAKCVGLVTILFKQISVCPDPVLKPVRGCLSQVGPAPSEHAHIKAKCGKMYALKQKKRNV